MNGILYYTRWVLGCLCLAVSVRGSNGAYTHYYAVTDRLGSVHQFVTTGGVVAQVEYDIRGNMPYSTANSAHHAAITAIPYRWQGREYSEATGLYHFRARWYDPVAGRFINKDPIGLAGGMNLYAFCGNDPVNFRDPYGLQRKVSLFEAMFPAHALIATQHDGYIGGSYDMHLQYATGLGQVRTFSANLAVAGASTYGVASVGVAAGPSVAAGVSSAGTKISAAATSVGARIMTAASSALAWVNALLQKGCPPSSPVLNTVDDVFANPNLLKGQSLTQIQNILGKSSGWINGAMQRSTTHPNGGWMLREMNKAGTDFTGRLIQCHPGTPRHFNGAPYWKVSSDSGTFRMPAN